MDPKQLFYDERLRDVCAYCWAPSDTRDHVPSKVLLDTPYPSGLPVVGACSSCNNGFSRHERVVACLIDCAEHGSATAPQLRPKVKRILSEDSGLAALMGHTIRAGGPRFALDLSVGQVVTKLAKGHLAFQEHLAADEPSAVRVAVRPQLTADDLDQFESLPSPGLLAEIGTRAFIDAFCAPVESPLDDQDVATRAGWSVVQARRYRYAVLLGQEHATVRFVLSEYLFCEVSW